MVMEPGFGLATVEKIAINAVMAGCQPAQFSILLAALECIAQPEMNHRDMQVSGHTEAPLILVNGPIAAKAGINYGTSAMGPGVVNKANTAIGRALRLCLINIGYCKAGAGDPNFIGLPTKFGMCIAENEEVSPWQPYHVDKGFRPDESAVTVITVTGPTDILDAGSRNHEDTLNNIASMMFYRHAGGGSWIRGRQSAQVGHTNQRVEYQSPYHPIMLSPSRAVILQEAGFSKRLLRSGCTSIAAPRCATPSARPECPPTPTASGCAIRISSTSRMTQRPPYRPWKTRSSTCCS